MVVLPNIHLKLAVSGTRSAFFWCPLQFNDCAEHSWFLRFAVEGERRVRDLAMLAARALDSTVTSFNSGVAAVWLWLQFFVVISWSLRFASHMIHGTGIFTYVWLTFMIHVSKYSIWILWGMFEVCCLSFVIYICWVCQCVYVFICPRPPPQKKITSADVVCHVYSPQD